MKWSSRAADALGLGLALAGALVVGLCRAPLAKSFSEVKEGAAAYLLPGVEQTYVGSLGYRSAMADVIYGHVLVSYGLHFQRRRLFEHVGDYLDVINRLDPTFRAPYWYADTLLTLQPQAPPESFYRRARAIQERGLRNLPYDQELWSSSGQFLAYLAPGRLSNPAEQEEFRRAGAQHLMQACNLIGSNDNIPYHCVTAARLLNREGQVGAARDMLVRLQNMSEDPKLQELAAAYLSQIAGQDERMKLAAVQQRFRDEWQADLPLSPRVEIGALGPRFDAAACAGLRPSEPSRCATSWRSWGKLHGSSQP
ncbi:MAG: hypothetical protein EOO73_29695 [Myxococcales bacterium]|nr:MAG: hypothetical protein EOO73_29695 [Myxococcales bacterium]